MPPELIWHHDERMGEWWDGVKDRRKNPGAEPMEDVPTTSNKIADQYR